MRCTYTYVGMTKDEAQRSPSALLGAASLSTGRWPFYEAVNFNHYQVRIKSMLTSRKRKSILIHLLPNLFASAMESLGTYKQGKLPIRSSHQRLFCKVPPLYLCILKTAGCPVRTSTGRLCQWCFCTSILLQLGLYRWIFQAAS